jgi:alpha-beta hydrolase superfamily lysophospholipase
MAEHPERYAGLASALNDVGLIVWAHHQRGHGLNPVPGILGHFGDEYGWRALVDDTWAVSTELQLVYPETPLILFAHSMGSFVAQRVVAEHGLAYAAVILSGTNGPPTVQEGLLRGLAGLQVASLGKRAPGAWLQKIVIEDTYNRPFGPPPNSWLSRDASEVYKYNHDPLCGFPLTAQAWSDLLEGRASQSSVEFFAAIPMGLPIHIIFGTADPVGEQGVGVARLLRVLADAGLSLVTSQSYEAARHELVHETNRDQVTKDLIGWIKAIIGLS